MSIIISAQVAEMIVKGENEHWKYLTDTEVLTSCKNVDNVWVTKKKAIFHHIPRDEYWETSFGDMFAGCDGVYLYKVERKKIEVEQWVRV